MISFTFLILHLILQVLFERGKLQPKTQQILNNSLISVIKESLAPGSEFWDASKTLKTLAESRYFEDDKGETSSTDAGQQTWPDVIKEMVSESKGVKTK